MTLLHRLASIAWWLLRRNRAEQQLDDEVRTYVEMAAENKVREGFAPAEARRQAILELGGIEQAKERVRTDRHGGRIDEIGRDVRYAFRTFGKNRGFAVTVVLTLALGIGANAAIFSLIDALMLRWLPVRDPQELLQVQFQTTDDNRGFEESLSYPIVRALAGQHDIFAGLAGFSGSRFDVGAPGSVHPVSGALVTGGYYDTLGLNPVIGRLLTRGDDERGAPLVAVISYGYWERQFARSPAAVGTTLLVHGIPVTIVGVSPRGFVGTDVGAVADITMTVAALPEFKPDAAGLLGPGNVWLRALARPRQGLSAAEAQARLAAVWPHIAESVLSPRWPVSRRKAMAEASFRLSPGGTGWSYLRRIYTKPLAVLMAMVVLVLLIACANIASLLLARASARQREIAVRLAMGAGRRRIVRQFLIESLVLSLIGAAFGIGLAWLSARFLVDLISTGNPRVTFDLTPNWHILAFTGSVAIVAAVSFGVAPALQATMAGPSLALKEDARMSGSRSRLLPWLVSAQVALSMILLVGAGLFVRTLENLEHFDPGFTSHSVLLVDLEPVPGAALQQIVADLRHLPGVASASVSTHTPLSGSIWSEPAVPAGQPLSERDSAVFVGAGPGFFTTLQIPLVAGREFTEHDPAEKAAVAVINQRFAERYFPNANPIGQHLSAKVHGSATDLEVIGVARNTSSTGLRLTPPPIVYVAYAQVTGGDFPLYPTLEIRASGKVTQVASSVRDVVRHRLPTATFEVRALSAQVEATMVQERMMATLAGAFGVLALMLACIGLYGLLSYTVARRTREIGIRMALGARRAQVIAHVVAGGVRLVAIGIAIGIPAAWAASRAIGSMLFSLKPGDPAAIAGAALILTAATQLAAYLPARRAARVDPLTALRHE